MLFLMIKDTKYKFDCVILTNYDCEYEQHIFTTKKALNNFLESNELNLNAYKITNSENEIAYKINYLNFNKM